jgi:carbon-monoxide dehydrogenase large subunit
VDVEYEELPVITDGRHSMDDGAPVIREDLVGSSDGAHGKRIHDNHIFRWDVGDADATDKAFADAPLTVSEDITYQRVHPCPLETCGCVSDFDKIRGELTVYLTSQAPHVVRTVVSMLSGIAESKIHVIAPDIGGGFGGKVGVYPGYVCAIVGRRSRAIIICAARSRRTAGVVSRACESMSSQTMARSIPARIRPSSRRACSVS